MDRLKILENKIGYNFKNKKLLVTALTHKSYKTKDGQYPQNNERLEFLGDAVLSLAISKLLFKKFKTSDEGILSKYRSLLVSRKHLFKIAKKLSITRFINMGESEKKLKSDQKKNISANAVESLIAAIYLDGGMKNTEHFIEKYFSQYISKRSLSRLNQDYKSKLQEYSQKLFKTLPSYTTLPCTNGFESKVHIKGIKKRGKGKGLNKRMSEQMAAKNLLSKI